MHAHKRTRAKESKHTRPPAHTRTRIQCVCKPHAFTDLLTHCTKIQTQRHTKRPGSNVRTRLRAHAQQHAQKQKHKSKCAHRFKTKYSKQTLIHAYKCAHSKQTNTTHTRAHLPCILAHSPPRRPTVLVHTYRKGLPALAASVHTAGQPAPEQGLSPLPCTTKIHKHKRLHTYLHTHIHTYWHDVKLSAQTHT